MKSNILEFFETSLSRLISKVSGEKLSVFDFIIEALKAKINLIKQDIEESITESRLSRVNKKINKITKTTSGDVDLKQTRFIAKRLQKLEQKKEALQNKFKFLTKTKKKIKEFDSTIDSILGGDIDLSEAPIIVKIGIGALVANIAFTVTPTTSFASILSYRDFNYTFDENVDWTSYAKEVNGIKYQRSTVSGAPINNPMNLRPPRNTPYAGQVGMKEVYRSNGESIGYFAIFSDPYYSFKAAAGQILRYRDSDDWEWKRRRVGASKGSLTILQMLNIYAPPEDDNSPNKYAELVMKYSDGKIRPNDFIKIDTDKEQFKYLIRAMARVENSALVDLDYLDMVWESMFGNGAPPLQETLKTQSASKPTIYTQTGTSRIEGLNNYQHPASGYGNVGNFTF